MASRCGQVQTGLGLVRHDQSPVSPGRAANERAYWLLGLEGPGDRCVGPPVSAAANRGLIAERCQYSHLSSRRDELKKQVRVESVGDPHPSRGDAVTTPSCDLPLNFGTETGIANTAGANDPVLALAGASGIGTAPLSHTLTVFVFATAGEAPTRSPRDATLAQASNATRTRRVLIIVPSSNRMLPDHSWARTPIHTGIYLFRAPPPDERASSGKPKAAASALLR